MNVLVDAIGTVMRGEPATLVSIHANDLWGAELAAGFTVSQWLATADTDRRKLLLNIATKMGFPDDVGEALTNRFFLSQFLLLDGPESTPLTEATGLGAAVLLNGSAVSLASEEPWRTTYVPLRQVWYDQDGSEQQTDIRALNLSDSTQANDVSDVLLQKKQLKLVGEAGTLRERKSEYFPHLSFGLDIDRQIAQLPHTLRATVVAKLAELDTASRDWRRDPKSQDPKLPNCRSESAGTMEQYGDRRLFRDPSGNKKTYILHKSVGETYRIHLRVVYGWRCLEVGYVGRHLPTKRHN